MKKNHLLLTILAATVLVAASPRTWAHGFEGDYFFPATLTTDDPFAADEASLPTFSTIKGPDGTRVNELSWDIAKSITPTFGIEVGQEIDNIQTPGAPQETGVGNLEISAIYECYQNPVHQFIFSAGFDGEIGSTGRMGIGDPFSTWTPTLYFGKGFGDLPDGLAYLQPLGMTGTFGVSLPTSTSEPDSLEMGLAIEYNVLYLQEHVHDFGLPEPLKRLIPLVEFDVESPLNRGEAGFVNGTMNPGIIWAGKNFQLGVEAIVPLNARTGNDIGVIAQVHLYLDDMLPSIFHPLLGGNNE